MRYGNTKRLIFEAPNHGSGMTRDRSDGWSGLFIPAGLFIGLGIGFIVGQVVGGVLLGLGAGFLGMAISKIAIGSKRK